MALPATDSFTTGTSQALTSYSANWTNSSNSHYVDATNDDVRPNVTAAECCSYWNADSFSTDQYSKGTYKRDSGAGKTMGTAVRATTGGTYYGHYYDAPAGTWYSFEMSGGTWTQKATTGSNLPSTGDTYKMTALINGATSDMKVYKNDSTLISALSFSDNSRQAGGAAGITSYYDGVSDITWIDDWEGGDVGGAVENELESAGRGIGRGIMRGAVC
jgi:hypothetical protein